MNLASPSVGRDTLEVSVSEHALSQGGENRAADALLLDGVEQAGFWGALEHTVLGLMHDAGRAEVAEDGASPGGIGRVIVGDGGVEGLARADGVGERPHGFFHRGVRVAPVTVEDIDVGEPHPLQRLVQRGEEVFARAKVAMRARPHGIARLGRDDQLVAIGAEVFAENPTEGFLGRARDGPVVVREVEVGDAEVEGP